jgi:hypothetical protein
MARANAQGRIHYCRSRLSRKNPLADRRHGMRTGQMRVVKLTVWPKGEEHILVVQKTSAVGN